MLPGRRLKWFYNQQRDGSLAGALFNDELSTLGFAKNDALHLITNQFMRRHHFLVRAANSLGDKIGIRDSPASASKSSSPVTIACTFAA